MTWYVFIDLNKSCHIFVQGQFSIFKHSENSFFRVHINGLEEICIDCDALLGEFTTLTKALAAVKTFYSSPVSETPEAPSL